MANYSLKYGAYIFPRTFAVVEDRPPNVVPQQKVARADGGRVLRGSIGPRHIRVSGTLFGPDAPIGGVADWRTELDALWNALHANAPAVMYTTRDDRYLRSVHCETPYASFDPNSYGRIGHLDLDFVSSDPFYYDVASNTDTWNISGSGQTHNLIVAGIEPTFPVFSITVGGAGSVAIAYAIQNNRTGVNFTLTGTVNAGDLIVVDCLQQTVTIGGVDKMSLFDGRWIALVAGVANTLTEAYTGTVISQVVTSWQNRYLSAS